MNNIQLSDIELYWLDVARRDEQILEELVDKSDILITEKFIQFLKMILKYKNLNISNVDDNVVYKKLIRIHRNVPIGYLNHYKYEYIIFSGLYVVMDVVFHDVSILQSYRKGDINRDKIASLGIPDSVLYNIPKDVKIDDVEKSCFLVRNDLTDRFITYQRDWSFPTFRY